jgi:DUF4097 and DUF4098 domain-containing protein YvlB
MPEFDYSTPVTVALRMPNGTADIHAEDRTSVLAEVVPLDGSSASRHAAEQTLITLDGDTLVVRAPESGNWRRSGRLAVTIRVPLDSSIAARLPAVHLRATGRFAQAQVTAASGEAVIDDVTGDATLEAASGELTIRRVGGALRIRSASGDLSIGDVTGDVTAETASGRLGIRRADASVRAHSASGAIEIGAVRQGETGVRSISGNVQVGVAAGTGVWLDVSTVSGSASNELAMGADAPAAGTAATLQLRIRTVSGDIHIHRAAATFPAAA